MKRRKNKEDTNTRSGVYTGTSMLWCIGSTQTPQGLAFVQELSCSGVLVQHKHLKVWRLYRNFHALVYWFDTNTSRSGVYTGTFMLWCIGSTQNTSRSGVCTGTSMIASV